MKDRLHSEILACKDRELKYMKDPEIVTLIRKREEREKRVKEIAYILSPKVCVKPNDKKVVQFPSNDLIDKYVANGGHEPYSLAAILTCPAEEDYMNYMLNTGEKTN